MDKFKVVQPGDKPPKRNAKGIKSLDKFALDDIDKKLLTHLANYPRSTLQELGDLVNYTARGVQKRMLRPAFKKGLERLNEDTFDILVRVQRRATQRLMDLVNDSDKRIALDAVRLALTPMLNKGTLEVKDVQEIIHRVQFGDKGEILRDVIEVKNDEQEPKTTMELLK